MIRLCHLGIMACGLAAMLLGGGWLWTVRTTLAPSEIGPIAPLYPETRFVGVLRTGTFHEPYCIYIQPGQPAMDLHGQEEAERFGHACPHCLSELAAETRTALRPRQP